MNKKYKNICVNLNINMVLSNDIPTHNLHNERYKRFLLQDHYLSHNHVQLLCLNLNLGDIILLFYF